MNKSTQIREIEIHLKNYRTYLSSIQNLKKQLDWIMPNITTNYVLREGSVGTFSVESKVEQAVLDRIEGRRALNISEQITIYENIVSAIDTAITSLSPTEQEFVRTRYFEGKNFKELTDELKSSERKLNNIRRALMEKLLISLHCLFYYKGEF